MLPLPMTRPKKNAATSGDARRTEFLIRRGSQQLIAHQERSVAVPPERAAAEAPRVVFAYIEVRTPSMAERRPTRVVPPPRRMRATAAAQDTLVLAEDVDFFEFAKLIRHQLPRRPVRDGDPCRDRVCRSHPWSRGSEPRRAEATPAAMPMRRSAAIRAAGKPNLVEKSAASLAHEAAAPSLGPESPSVGRAGSSFTRRNDKSTRSRENGTVRLGTENPVAHRRRFIPPGISFLYRTKAPEPRKKRPYGATFFEISSDRCLEPPQRRRRG